MNSIEKSEILNNALDWIYEHSENNEAYYNTLKHIGMNEEEIKKEKEQIESWE